MTPASASLRRAMVRSMIDSNTVSRPCRRWPTESKAPALISASTVFLLSTEKSTRSQKSKKSRYGPLASRSAMISSQCPVPTPRTADMPNTISAPTMSPASSRFSSGAKSTRDRLTSATVTGMSMARHSAR